MAVITIKISHFLFNLKLIFIFRLSLICFRSAFLALAPIFSIFQHLTIRVFLSFTGYSLRRCILFAFRQFFAILIKSATKPNLSYKATSHDFNFLFSSVGPHAVNRRKVANKVAGVTMNNVFFECFVVQTRIFIQRHGKSGFYRINNKTRDFLFEQIMIISS
jgi:hypothetical protein